MNYVVAQKGAKCFWYANSHNVVLFTSLHGYSRWLTIKLLAEILVYLRRLLIQHREKSLHVQVTMAIELEFTCKNKSNEQITLARIRFWYNPNRTKCEREGAV
jgi:hypothetical protein